MIHNSCGNNAGTNDQLLARWKDVSCEYVACRENERKFLALELTKTMISIERASGRLKAVISDARRAITTVEEKPWLTVEGTYLLYDFVHLLKNIRNLWLTEKTTQLT